MISFGDLSPFGELGGDQTLTAARALGAALLWGSSTVLGRLILKDMPFHTLTGARLLTATPLLFAIVLAQDSIGETGTGFSAQSGPPHPGRQPGPTSRHSRRRSCPSRRSLRPLRQQSNPHGGPRRRPRSVELRRRDLRALPPGLSARYKRPLTRVLLLRRSVPGRARSRPGHRHRERAARFHRLRSRRGLRRPEYGPRTRISDTGGAVRAGPRH